MRLGDKFPLGEELVLCFGLGLGITEIIFLGLGFLGLFYRQLIYLLFFLLLILTLPEWRHFCWRILEEFWKKRSGLKITKLSMVLIFLIFLRLLICFLAAQAPITEGDSLWYHLTLPKIFIAEHKFSDPGYLSSYLTLNTEMLYTGTWLLRNEILAQSLSFLVGGVFLTLAIYFLAKNFLSKSGALLTAFFFITTPLIAWEASTPKNDLFWTFFILLGYFSLWRWLNLPKRNLLTLSALFFGFAFGTKGVLSFFPMIGVVPIFVIDFVKRKKLDLIGLIVFGSVCLLPYFPYLLRNYFLTGNPLFPFLVKTFGAGGLNADWLTTIHRSKYSADLSWPGFLLLPWKITMFPIRYGGDIGPIYLAFLPIGIFLGSIRNKSWLFRVLLFFSFICLGIWYWFLIPSVRYLLPFFPVAAGLAAMAIIALMQASKFAKRIMIGFLTIYIFTSFLTYFFNFEPYWPKLKVAIGLKNREAYLIEQLPYTADLLWINDNLSASAKVLLFLNEWQRPFYLDRPFIFASNPQREINFKITHIYGKKVSGSEKIWDSIIADGLKNGLVEKIYDGVGGGVYEIK